MDEWRTDSGGDESREAEGVDELRGDPPMLRESGLARSIRALFEEPGHVGEAGRNHTTSHLETEDAVAGSPSGRGSIRDAFTTRVARYLRAAPEERDRLVGGILEEARRLRRAQEIRAVSDAAVSLALQGEDRDDEAARALALELMDPAVVSHLAVRIAMDPDSEAREALARVAMVFPATFAPVLADALPEAPDRAARRGFMDALIDLGDEGRQAVVLLLEDPRWYAVRDAIELLPEMEGKDAVQDLTSALAHDDPRLRRETLHALARIGGEAAGLLILGMLNDPEAEVRAAAAEGAGSLRLARAQRPLATLIEEEREESVAVAAIRALGRIRDPGSVPALEKRATGSIFARPARSVRIAAYRALAEIGTPHARRVLEGALSDRDRDIREAVGGLLAEETGVDPEELDPASSDLEDGP